MPTPASIFTLMPATWLEARTFDGRMLSAEERKASEFHVLPGRHRLTVELVHDTSAGTYGAPKSMGGAIGLGILQGLFEAAAYVHLAPKFQQDLEIDAEAGRTYAIRYSFQRPSAFSLSGSWKTVVWVDEWDTGMLGAGKAR